MRLGMILVLLLFSAAVSAAGEVALPWEEFKHLYREKIEREIAPKPADETPVYTLTSAHYTLAIGSDSVRGEMKLSGAVLNGKVDQIPIFKGALAIQKIGQVVGGHLVVDQNPARMFTSGRPVPRLLKSVWAFWCRYGSGMTGVSPNSRFRRP